MTGIEILEKEYNKQKVKLDKQKKKCHDAEFAYMAAKYPTKEAAELNVLIYANSLNW